MGSDLLQRWSNFSAFEELKKVTFASKVKGVVGGTLRCASVESGFYRMRESALVHPVKNVGVKCSTFGSFNFSAIQPPQSSNPLAGV